MIPSLEVARRRGRSARVNSRFGQRGSICRTSSARGRVHCGARERRPRSVWIRGPGSPGRQKRLRPPSRLRPHLAPPRRQAQPRLASRQPPASPAPPFISCLRGGLAPDHEGLGQRIGPCRQNALLSFSSCALRTKQGGVSCHGHTGGCLVQSMQEIGGAGMNRMGISIIKQSVRLRSSPHGGGRTRR